MPIHIRHPPEMHESDQITYLILGVAYTNLLYVAARLGIADLLKDGPKSADELARACEVHGPSLYRVLRALASLGVFAQTDQPGYFTLTPLAQRLRSDVPESMRDWCIMCGSEWHTRSWGELFYSVQKGLPSFDRIFGSPIFDYLEKNPGTAAEFHRGVASKTSQHVPELLKAYDFSRFQQIVDVGGGHGAFVASLLEAHPKLRAVHFDQPSVIGGARELCRQRGVAERCEFVGGDFFESVPAGGDLYFLKYIMHDWDDRSCATILRNCRAAISPKGKLVLVDAVVPNSNDPSISKLADGVLLVVTSGKERTKDEFAELLSAAGFRLTQVLDTGHYVSLIEAEPV